MPRCGPHWRPGRGSAAELTHARTARHVSLDRDAASRRHARTMPSYSANERAFHRARQRIEARRYVLRSDWGERQPRAADRNRYLASHSWDEYAEWHLGL